MMTFFILERLVTGGTLTRYTRVTRRLSIETSAKGAFGLTIKMPNCPGDFSSFLQLADFMHNWHSYM